MVPNGFPSDHANASHLYSGNEVLVVGPGHERVTQIRSVRDISWNFIHQN